MFPHNLLVSRFHIGSCLETHLMLFSFSLIFKIVQMSFRRLYTIFENLLSFPCSISEDSPFSSWICERPLHRGLGSLAKLVSMVFPWFVLSFKLLIIKFVRYNLITWLQCKCKRAQWKRAFLLPSTALLLFSKCPHLPILYLYIYIIPYYRAKNDSVTIG